MCKFYIFVLIVSNVNAHKILEVYTSVESAAAVSVIDLESSKRLKETDSFLIDGFYKFKFNVSEGRYRLALVSLTDPLGFLTILDEEIIKVDESDAKVSYLMTAKYPESILLPKKVRDVIATFPQNYTEIYVVDENNELEISQLKSAPLFLHALSDEFSYKIIIYDCDYRQFNGDQKVIFTTEFDLKNDDLVIWKKGAQEVKD